MIKKYITIAFFLAISFTHSFAQIADSLEKFKPKLIVGYFILLRDSIIETNKDVTAPLMDFKVFYVDKLESINFESLQRINRPANDSIVFVSGGTNYAIASSQEQKMYINWLINNKYFEKADKGVNFYDVKKIPPYLLKSKRRFASIYKGSLTVVGSFYPFNKLNLKSQSLFMYLPVETNRTEYKYSIVF